MGKPFDPDNLALTFKTASLPREKKKKLRDLVVWAVAVSRHEVRLRWQAEHERDEARHEHGEAQQRCKGLEADHRRVDAELGLAKSQVRELRGMLDEANRRLRDLGGTPVEPVLPVREGKEDEFIRSRYIAPFEDGKGEGP